MSALHLNALAGRVLLDDNFRWSLLGSREYDCLADIPLTDEERVAILAKRSADADRFIWELYDLMCGAGLIRPSSLATSHFPAVKPLKLINGPGGTFGTLPETGRPAAVPGQCLELNTSLL